MIYRSYLPKIMMLLLSCSLAFGQGDDFNKLFRDFQSTNWPDVLKAKEQLENMQEKVIPRLIKLLDDKSVKKLVNTDDLIYPGAERFFGFGQIIDYDIDKLDVRAGWLLEELTFQNFGFSGVQLEPTRLNDFIRINFPDHLNSHGNRKFLDNAPNKEKRELIRKLSAQKAQAWWKSEQEGWSRHKALVEALSNEDEKRQAKALFYIRNGKTSCTGLTAESFEQHIEHLVVGLSKSKLPRVSEQAKLILLDSNRDWLRLKTSASPSN